MLLLRERLEHIKLAAPVCELELVADEIAADANANLELFPSAQSESNLVEPVYRENLCPPGAPGHHRLESYPRPSAGT